MTGIYRTGRFANVDDETIGRARTNNDVAAIVDQMYVDLREHPREWENYTLESYLDALSRSLESPRSLYRNRGESFARAAYLGALRRSPRHCHGLRVARPSPGDPD